jgi:hypothetical protein
MIPNTDAPLPDRVEYRGMTFLLPPNDSEWRGYFEAARAGRLAGRAAGSAIRPAPGARGAGERSSRAG